jgi:hypothetical protein
MLMYVTGSEGRSRVIHAPDTLPETLVKLYQRAMRDHVRPAAAEERSDGRWHKLPDWRFDRQVIQIALFLKERLGIEGSTPAGLLGSFSPRWVQADFALQGLGALPIGLHPDLSDADLGAALSRDAIRGVMTTDQDAANRIQLLRSAGVVDLDWIVVPGAGEGEDDVVGWDFLWDRGQSLDTPERAANWRYYAREITADHIAGIHYEQDPDNGFNRVAFTHAEAIEGVGRLWAQCPAREGDVAYLDAPHATLAGRIAAYAWVGDGVTVTLSYAGLSERGWQALDVTKLLASPEWLEALARDLRGANGRWSGRKAQKLVRERVGERLRGAWPAGPCPPDLLRALGDAGLSISNVGLDLAPAR